MTNITIDARSLGRANSSNSSVSSLRPNNGSIAEDTASSLDPNDFSFSTIANLDRCHDHDDEASVADRFSSVDEEEGTDVSTTVGSLRRGPISPSPPPRSNENEPTLRNNDATKSNKGEASDDEHDVEVENATTKSNGVGEGSDDDRSAPKSSSSHDDPAAALDVASSLSVPNDQTYDRPNDNDERTEDDHDRPNDNDDGGDQTDDVEHETVDNDRTIDDDDDDDGGSDDGDEACIASSPSSPASSFRHGSSATESFLCDPGSVQDEMIRLKLELAQLQTNLDVQRNLTLRISAERYDESHALQLAHEEAARLSKRNEALEREKETLRGSRRDADREFLAVAAERDDLRTRCETLESAAEDLEVRLRGKESLLETLMGQAESDSARRDAERLERDAYRVETESLRTKYESLLRKQQQLTAESSVRTENNKDDDAFERRHRRLRTALQEAEAARDRYKADYERLCRENQNLNAYVDALSAGKNVVERSPSRRWRRANGGDDDDDDDGRRNKFHIPKFSFAMFHSAVSCGLKPVATVSCGPAKTTLSCGIKAVSSSDAAAPLPSENKKHLK